MAKAVASDTAADGMEASLRALERRHQRTSSVRRSAMRIKIDPSE